MVCLPALVIATLTLTSIAGVSAAFGALAMLYKAAGTIKR